MKKKKAYYAHCMALYDTPQEKRDLKTIKSLGFNVLNPNTKVHQNRCKLGPNTMKYFTDLVRDCDLLIFRALPTGEIPSGVAKEIEAAQRQHKPIIELPHRVNIRMLDYKETVDYLVEVGQR